MTPQVVLTTLKCFIRVKAVKEYYGLPQLSKIKQFKGFSKLTGLDLDPAEIIVAQVIAKNYGWVGPDLSLYCQNTNVWVSSYIMGLNCSTNMGLSYATPIRHVILHMASHDWS